MVWGATPHMDSATPVTPALLPAQGRQRDGKRQSDPPALQSVDDPVVLLPASYPCARQSAIQRTPPSPLPCPDPVRVD